MPRTPYGSLKTIEYIGPRPQKPKKNFFGGWVILLIAVGMALFFGRPLLASLRSEQVVGTEAAADQVIEELRESKKPGDKLAVAALALTKNETDAVPVNSTAELITAAYRDALGLDLKELLHEDMSNAFTQYPQLWNERGPNKEMDASRVPNLQRFFHRSGDDMSQSEVKVGDVIFWTLPDGNGHAAIVVPGPGLHANEKWIVHFWQKGVVWENKLRDFTMVLGRYRFGH
jgi:uncharacterized protein